MNQVGNVSSPLATGGAGSTFEQHVGAMFLGLLLIKGTPAVFKDCQVDEVAFQTKHLGWQTDDLLVVCSSPSHSRVRLAMQIKRTFQVQVSSEDCRETFQRFWNDFNDSDKFVRGRDALVLVTLHGTKKLLTGFGGLLDCARNSTDELDFTSRIKTAGLVSNDTRDCAKVIRTILSSPDSTASNDKDFWEFLKSVYLLSVDLTTSTAQNEGYIKDILALASTQPDQRRAAESTWLQLVSLASAAGMGAQTLTRQNLPDHLLSSHQAIDNVQAGIRVHRDHSQLILDSIRSDIGGSVALQRKEIQVRSMDALSNQRVLLLTGPPGCGKSAVAKSIVLSAQGDFECMSFRAEEFAKNSIDDVLRGSITGVQLRAFLGAQQKALIHIESVERLLEQPVRDAFSELVRILEECENTQLVLTCRDYASVTVVNAFFRRGIVTPAILELPPLADSELDDVIGEFPALEIPFSRRRIKDFLRNPFFLDIAARIDWLREDDLPADPTTFRRRCWSEVVRCDSFTQGAMPDRREKAIVTLAEKRARELRPFVPADSIDTEALDSLVKDGIAIKDDTGFAAPAHDVIEDWAIIRWSETVVAHHQWQVARIAESVGEYPAIRRGFREWLKESLERESDKADQLVLSGYSDESIAQSFRDDLLVSMLRSNLAGDFIRRRKSELLAGEGNLLIRVIHLLRMTCKKSPDWLNDRQITFSSLLVPDGQGWPALLEVACENLASLVPAHTDLLVGLLEDWSRGIGDNLTIPEGAVPAGNIAFALLDGLTEWRDEDLRKRVLLVIAKVPRCNESRFAKLIQGTSDSGKGRNARFDELAEIFLCGTEGTAACREYPQMMAEFALTNYCLSDPILGGRLGWSLPDVDDTFGINHSFDMRFFPESAWQGPFRPLLYFHPGVGVQLVLNLSNHAGNWYGERRTAHEVIEPACRINLQIPGQANVEQWANDRLWRAYRGSSVVPHVIQSALMALEAWLLDMCEDAREVEPWLVKILQESNNVMTTAVIASVCAAYPKAGGSAALALLTSREALKMDLHRMAGESESDVLAMFPHRDPMAQIFQKERERSNSLQHRREHLETLAIKMQFRETREEVWRIIDNHYDCIPEGEQRTEDDRTFSLALLRMDVRRWEAVETTSVSGNDASNDASEEEQLVEVKLKPKFEEQDQDLRDFMEEGAQWNEKFSTSAWLTGWGLKSWRDGSTDDNDTWRTALGQAKECVQRAPGEELLRFGDGAAGYVAAICIRDHWHQMTEANREWCLGTAIVEVERDCDSRDYLVAVSRNHLSSDRPAAYVLPKVLGFNPSNERVLMALANAITHTADEVSLWCAEGVRDYLAQDNSALLMHCAGAFALQATLLAELERQERTAMIDHIRGTASSSGIVSHIQGLLAKWFHKTTPTKSEQTREFVENIQTQVRRAFVSRSIDYDASIEALDLTIESARALVPQISLVLSGVPESDIAFKFHSRVAQAVVDSWTQEKSERYGSERNYGFEHGMMDRIARFVLTLRPDVAICCCEPILAAADTHPREVDTFVGSLIALEDQATSETPFWEVWQTFANRVVDARWLPSLSTRNSSGASLVDKMLFGVPWKEGIQQWRRLKGHEKDVNDFVGRMPAVSSVMLAYVRYLHSIGGVTLPDSFDVVATLLRRGDRRDLLSNENTVHYLESLLGRYVYGEPMALKSDPTLRAAILFILDQLVESGSAAAYTMRDDFVTPVVWASNLEI